MADIQALVASMREHGDFREVGPHDPLPACITYAVVQGTDILTIGSGGGDARKFEALASRVERQIAYTAVSVSPQLAAVSLLASGAEDAVDISLGFHVGASSVDTLSA